MKRLAACVLAVCFALPIAGHARSHLQDSLPSVGSTIRVSPERLLLMFSEAVELTSLTLHRAGDRQPLKVTALPDLPGRPVSVALPKLAAGVYTVRYWVMSSDLRETRGSFEFTLAMDPEWPRARRTAEAKARAK